jgi:hypothetical protein
MSAVPSPVREKVMSAALYTLHRAMVHFAPPDLVRIFEEELHAHE